MLKSMFSFLVLTVCLPLHAVDHPTAVLHLAVHGTRDHVSSGQVVRMRARIDDANPTREYLDFTRNASGYTPATAPTLLGQDVIMLQSLNDYVKPIDLVIIQATTAEYASVLARLERGEDIFPSLNGHLTADARIVLAGDPALPEDQASAAMTALNILKNFNVARGSLVTATSRTELPHEMRDLRPDAKALGALGFAYAGIVASLSTFNDPGTLITFPIAYLASHLTLKGVDWVRSLVANVEDGDSSISVRQYYAGDTRFRLKMGLAGLVTGLYYAGTSFIDAKYLGATVGLTLLTQAVVTGFPLFENLRLRRDVARGALNQGRLYVAVGDRDLKASVIRTDAPEAFSCAQNLGGL